MMLTLLAALLTSPADTAFVLDRDDVAVESIGYDAGSGRFYAGDLARGKILQIDRHGRSRVWFQATGQAVLGIKVDPTRNLLWACLAVTDPSRKNRARSALVAIDLVTARQTG